MNQIEISLTKLNALRSITSTDETRMALHGVRVENAKKGIVFIATDGRRIIVYEQPDANAIDSAFTIPNDLIDFFRGHHGNLVVESLTQDNFTMQLDGISISAATTLPAFPKWRAVIDGVEVKANQDFSGIALNPELLAPLLTAVITLSDRRNSAIKVRATATDMDPVSITADCVSAMIMPMRVYDQFSTALATKKL